MTLYGFRATIKEMWPAVLRPIKPAASGSRLEMKVPRMTCKPFLAHSGFWFVCAALVLSGCQEQEQIRSYDVPKETFSVAAPAEKQRLLAVMVPREKEVWFFKLMGPEKAVGENVQTFDRFIESLRFQGKEGEAVSWTKPDGWKRIAEGGELYARLRQEEKEPALEITITKLPPGAKDPRANIDRWRGQLGLGPIDDADLKKLVGNIKVDGVEATRVDFVGRAKKRGGPAFAHARPFRYTKPESWEERPADNAQGRSSSGGLSGPRRRAPRRSVGGTAGRRRRRSGEPTSIAGGRQLGLEPLDDAQLRRISANLDVAGGKAPYIDLTGRDPTGPAAHSRRLDRPRRTNLVHQDDGIARTGRQTASRL